MILVFEFAKAYLESSEFFRGWYRAYLTEMVNFTYTHKFDDFAKLCNFLSKTDRLNIQCIKNIVDCENFSEVFPAFQWLERAELLTGENIDRILRDANDKHVFNAISVLNRLDGGKRIEIPDKNMTDPSIGVFFLSIIALLASARKDNHLQSDAPIKSMRLFTQANLETLINFPEPQTVISALDTLASNEIRISQAQFDLFIQHPNQKIFARILVHLKDSDIRFEVRDSLFSSEQLNALTEEQSFQILRIPPFRFSKNRWDNLLKAAAADESNPGEFKKLVDNIILGKDTNEPLAQETDRASYRQQPSVDLGEARRRLSAFSPPIAPSATHDSQALSQPSIGMTK